MSKSKQLTPIKFHEDTIYSIEHNGQPFTPVRPIVENLGITWSPQAAKLRNNKERWAVVTMIVTTEKDGKNYEMACIPVRKVAGFLATINPLKVGNKLRPKIVQYQNECDDVLWDYWTKGHAINPRKQTLTPEQQRQIQKIVAAKVSGWESTPAKKGYAAIYRSIKDEFQVGTYKDVPEDQFGELIKFLDRSWSAPATEKDFNQHVPNRIDSLIQYYFRCTDEIMGDLEHLPPANSRVAMNVAANLIRMANVLGAAFPHEVRWLRHAKLGKTEA